MYGSEVSAFCDPVRRYHSEMNPMRKIVYNLLKLDPSVQGMSVKAKQVYYRNNPDAICKLIFEVIPGVNL